VAAIEPFVTVPPGVNPPLWMQNATYPAIVDRDLIDTLFNAAGVVLAGDLAVAQRAAGANMSVDVAPGRAVVVGNDAAGQGKYLCRQVATVNLPVAVAPGPGTSRIDLVIAHVYDDAVIGGTDHAWIPEIVQGAAAASPVAPAQPNSSLVLAQLSIPTGLASVVAGNITDRRVRASANDLPWNAAWGRIGVATATINNTIPSAITDWPSLSITWTPIAGRRYELFLTAPGVVPTNNPGNIVYYITDAANAVLAQIPIGGAGMGGTFNLPLNVRAAPISPAGGVPITHKCRYSSSSTNGQTGASATSPAVFTIDDIGPVTPI